MRMSAPAGTSFTNDAQLVWSIPALHKACGSLPIVMMSFSLTGKPTEFSIAVSLTSGPFVSIRIAILSDTFLTLSTIVCAPSMVACAELILTTFIPFKYRSLMKSSLHLKSEMVQIIFVFFCSMYLYN